MLLELMAAATGSVGFALGAVLARRARKPFCTCKHGYGTHDQGGPCTAQIERQLWSSYNEKAGTEWVPCPCKHYDGPAPPSQTFAPYVPWPPT